MTRDEVSLIDVLNAAKYVHQFVERMDRGTFLSDIKTQSAVIHQILVMGEATKRLSEEFTDQYPDVPWRDIAGMRDKLIHAYESVDLTQVWKVATQDVPPLIQRLSGIAPAREE